jgi:hypothetical protein
MGLVPLGEGEHRNRGHVDDYACREDRIIAEHSQRRRQTLPLAHLVAS